MVPNADNAFTLFYVKFRAAAPKVRVSLLTQIGHYYEIYSTSPFEVLLYVRPFAYTRKMALNERWALSFHIIAVYISCALKPQTENT